ncbi:unnamed protein product [Peniophora sp. CBMAI 1063]|nr:unnamed protein product [Peniophora sp. CBMAI 1063]
MSNDSDYVDSETGDINLSPGMGWSTITHVCRRWRALSIQHANLWTTIPLHLCTPWLQQIIDRSAGLPLDIILPCDTDQDVARQILAGNIHRIRSIHAECGFHIIESLLSTHRAPLLERLEVDGDWFQNPWNLPSELMNTCPLLSELSVAAITRVPKLHQGVLPITRLTIASTSFAPSREDLADLLRSLASVRFLQLEDCLTASSLGNILPDPLDLSLLETLILRGPASMCGDVLRSVTLPPFARVALYLLPDPVEVVNMHTCYDTSKYMECSGLNWLYGMVANSDYQFLRVSSLKSAERVHIRTYITITADRDGRGSISEGYMHDIPTLAYGYRGPTCADLKVVCMFQPPFGPIPQAGLPEGVLGRTMKLLSLASFAILSLDIDALASSMDSPPWNSASWLSTLAGANRVGSLELISTLDESSFRHGAAVSSSSYASLLLALASMDDDQAYHLMPHLRFLSLVDVYADATSDDINVERALRELVRSRRWRAGDVQVHYPTTMWQHQYLSKYQGSLKLAQTMALGLDHDWQLEELKKAVLNSDEESSEYRSYFRM